MINKIILSVDYDYNKSVINSVINSPLSPPLPREIDICLKLVYMTERQTDFLYSSYAKSL